ncbi:Hypothetical predicted protein [Octopus vulgaris]|uniref:Uncharacterized protein n=1 Tax=Octopus vulgaris TaxID=6645 RepID=A0AA36EY92_OCTVU|nr:Hypothetical predicted protein [Octopus vulgaris]
MNLNDYTTTNNYNNNNNNDDDSNNKNFFIFATNASTKSILKKSEKNCGRRGNLNYILKLIHRSQHQQSPVNIHTILYIKIREDLGGEQSITSTTSKLFLELNHFQPLLCVTFYFEIRIASSLYIYICEIADHGCYFQHGGIS